VASATTENSARRTVSSGCSTAAFASANKMPFLAANALEVSDQLALNPVLGARVDPLHDAEKQLDEATKRLPRQVGRSPCAAPNGFAPAWRAVELRASRIGGAASKRGKDKRPRRTEGYTQAWARRKAAQ
jgi:hypothetical protein